MIRRLYPDEFEQGYIHNIWDGANSNPNDGTSPSFHYSRIRTKNKYVYNGDGENLYINVTTINNPVNLYCSLSLYDLDGKWINDSTIWVKIMTKVTDNVFKLDITKDTYSSVSTLLGNSVGYLRISLTTTNSSSPKESDYITPNILNMVEVWSEDHWIMGDTGPELMNAPDPVPAMVKPYPQKLWRVSAFNNDGYPYSDIQVSKKFEAMTKPYPHSLWRIRDGVNDNYPYNILQPGTKYVEPVREYGTIELLDLVHVLSDPHGLDDWLPVRRMEIPLNNIQETRYILGKGYVTNRSSLSRIINKL